MKKTLTSHTSHLHTKNGEPLSVSFESDPTREKTDKYGYFFIFSQFLAMLFLVDADPLLWTFKPWYFFGVAVFALGGFCGDLKIWAVWAIQGLLICGFFLGGGLRWFEGFLACQPFCIMQVYVVGLWVRLAFSANMKDFHERIQQKRWKAQKKQTSSSSKKSPQAEGKYP